ncbi:MAG TPA: EAL domain-containing protein [Wenzhouxiangella sp.]|nr:EAL domain-containing protein [Wenzhouxiangella sp.]
MLTSLRQNLEWILFATIVLVATVLLVWGVLVQWDEIVDRHQLRQRAQLSTISIAVHSVFSGQETVLSLLSDQLLVHHHFGQEDAIRVLLDSMLEINKNAAGYGMVDGEGRILMMDLRPGFREIPGLENRLVEKAACDETGTGSTIAVGESFRVEQTGDWIIPMCKAVADEPGQAGGRHMVGALVHGEANSFFDDVAVLGRTNVIQVLHEKSLRPILWASSGHVPEDYLARPVPDNTYKSAVASAEKTSGKTLDEIRASSRPFPYQTDAGLGYQYGMAGYDSRYGFWVLTQTARKELLGELRQIGLIYTSIYLVALSGILAVLVVIARAERRRRSDLEYQARHDLLTGLPSRQHLMTEFLHMYGRHGKNMSLLFVDLDNFKSINDGFGYAYGDLLLKQVGQRLQAAISAQDRVARVGGDEFAVLVPESQQAALKQRCRAIHAELTRPYMINGLRFETGCSIGIARMQEAGPTFNEALRAGDIAMYAAKRRRVMTAVFRPAMGRNYLENIHIEQSLRAAIKKERIRVVYQPLVDSEERIVSVEALARWEDEELGEIPPQKFVSVAERAGLIGHLGEYIIDRCLRDARKIEQTLKSGLGLSINASPRQFQNDRFARMLVKRVSEAGLQFVKPSLEITESLFMGNSASIRNDLKAIRAAGIRVSLDDFGTGYSSLSMLLQLPIDELKIDKRFIDQMSASGGSRALVEGIIAIGHQHGLKVVAEGIENRAKFDLLRGAGCDVFQGFLFARPKSLDDLLAALGSAA